MLQQYNRNHRTKRPGALIHHIETRDDSFSTHREITHQLSQHGRIAGSFFQTRHSRLHITDCLGGSVVILLGVGDDDKAGNCESREDSSEKFHGDILFVQRTQLELGKTKHVEDRVPNVHRPVLHTPLGIFGLSKKRQMTILNSRIPDDSIRIFDHVCLFAVQFHGRESVQMRITYIIDEDKTGHFLFSRFSTTIFTTQTESRLSLKVFNDDSYLFKGTLGLFPIVFPLCSCKCRRLLQAARHFSPSHKKRDQEGLPSKIPPISSRQEQVGGCGRKIRRDQPCLRGFE